MGAIFAPRGERYYWEITQSLKDDFAIERVYISCGGDATTFGFDFEYRNDGIVILGEREGREVFLFYHSLYEIEPFEIEWKLSFSFKEGIEMLNATSLGNILPLDKVTGKHGHIYVRPMSIIDIDPFVKYLDTNFYFATYDDNYHYLIGQIDGECAVATYDGLEFAFIGNNLAAS